MLGLRAHADTKTLVVASKHCLSIARNSFSACVYLHSGTAGSGPQRRLYTTISRIGAHLKKLNKLAYPFDVSVPAGDQSAIGH